MSVIGKNYGKPTLDLNFAGNKSLIDTITRTNYVTFTRAQSGNEATYVGSDGLIKYASADEPRFDHDPETLESLGLLIEEQRTNKLINSSTFSSGYTVSADANIIPYATVAPDGTITASLLYPSVNTSDGTISQTIGSVTSDSYIVSVFAKSAGKNWIKLYNAQGNLSAWFNLDTGTAGTVTNENIVPYFTTSAIENFGNGWYRCSVKSTVTYNFFGLSVVDGDNSSSVTANETNGVYIWGAQLEAGAFATSYIPTSGSTETRAADEASITGSNFSSWYNQSEGSFIIDHRHDGVDTDGHLLEIGGTSGNYAFSHTAHFIQSTSASVYQSRSYFSGSGSPSSLFYFAKSTPTKVLYGYKSGDYAAGADGVLSTTSQSPWNLLVPTVDNYLGLGRRRDGTRSFQQLSISRLTYYPKRLPDIELQQLTK